MVDACTSTDFKVIEECIVRMTNILQWKNDDIEMLTRRGLLYYRMRQLAEAKADLDLAVQKSKESSVVSLPNLDSLRYRCLVLCEIRDVESALLDMQEVEKQTKDDPLVLSLRATILAGKGEIDEAERDLETVRRTLEMGGGSQSTLADENRDLDLLAKGWAHSSVSSMRRGERYFAFKAEKSITHADGPNSRRNERFRNVTITPHIRPIYRFLPRYLVGTLWFTAHFDRTRV